jgi:hypothetical protein
VGLAWRSDGGAGGSTVGFECFKHFDSFTVRQFCVRRLSCTSKQNLYQTNTQQRA